MIKRTLLLAGLLTAASLAANADVLSMPDAATAAPAPTTVPSRGMNMDNVRANYGEPASQRGPVGLPAITRWDYPGFVVIFENELVINTVVPTRPPTIYNKSGLQSTQ